jgi:hypothetical protein
LTGKIQIFPFWKQFGRDYFDELLERIREIRASEHRSYHKNTDSYALSVDYDKNAPITQEFFPTVQNKLHWAIAGKTAAEIIYESAEAKKNTYGAHIQEGCSNPGENQTQDPAV